MIFRVVLLALASSLIIVLIKENFRAGAIVLSIGVCTCIFAMCSAMLSSLFETIDQFNKTVSVSDECAEVIIKTLAVAYLTSFGVDVCKDSGEKAVANALETSGKIIMLSMALPMLLGIFRSVTEIIG